MNAIINEKKNCAFYFYAIEHLQSLLQCCFVAATGTSNSKASAKIERIILSSFIFLFFLEAKKAALKNMSTQNGTARIPNSRCSLKIHMKHFSFGKP